MNPYLDKLQKKLKSKEGEHLGGHNNITWVDEDALLFLKDRFPIKSMVDVGCGPGGMVSLARRHGIEAIGIDGDPHLKIYNSPRFIKHDFVQGPIEIKPVDLGWSVEFLEHVQEKYIPNFMGVFQKCSVVCVTYARPGKSGHHHVNCQEQEYWEDVFLENGLEIDKGLTKRIRIVSNMKFMKKTGCVFINKNQKIT